MDNTNETIRPLFDIVKGHQATLEGLVRIVGGLLAVLGGAGEPVAAARSEAQVAALRTVQEEIQQLEALFLREPGQPGGKTL